MKGILRRVNDLVLGVRLAVGGSRTPWGRLILTAVGIGLGVAVLLLASSVPNAVHAHAERRDSLRLTYPSPTDDQALTDAAMLVKSRYTVFRGQGIDGLAVQPLSPQAPLPDGVEQFPHPGEIVVSPALLEILRGPDAQLLKPRLPGQIVGVIGNLGLKRPGELFFYSGSDELADDPGYVAAVYPERTRSNSPTVMPPLAWITLAFGVVVLLVPIVVFVASSTRLAEAARERRLAALRLVGADARQVRRIASGEALVSAVLGVVVGWGMFLLGRQLAEHPPIIEFSVFSSDLVPVLPLAVAITLGVPAVAVATARISMRRTIIEPLGVVRNVRSGTRSLGWRLTPMILGVLGMLYAGLDDVSDRRIAFLGSISLLLVGVAVVLPWVVERLVGLFRANSVTWQLALRRLQFSSGTAARSVSAIAVVLAGVIGLQMVTASVLASETPASQPAETPRLRDRLLIMGQPTQSDLSFEVVRSKLESLPATAQVTGGVSFSVGATSEETRSVLIADCATLEAMYTVVGCRNGDAFRLTAQTSPRRGEPVQSGQRLPIAGHKPSEVIGDTEPNATWQVPWRLDGIQVHQDDVVARWYDIALTPAAASGIPWWAKRLELAMRLRDDASPDAIERVRNIVAVNLEQGDVFDPSRRSPAVVSTQYQKVRYGLWLGTLLAFLLIGCGVFVSAVEQIRERRRPTAVLAAVGVRRRTLAWSAFLQNALPMFAAVALAIVSGLLLGGLVILVTPVDGFAFDLVGLLGLLGIAAGSVFVVTALTLPALRNAMHPDGLHTE